MTYQSIPSKTKTQRGLQDPKLNGRTRLKINKAKVEKYALNNRKGQQEEKNQTPRGSPLF